MLKAVAPSELPGANIHAVDSDADAALERAFAVFTIGSRPFPTKTAAIESCRDELGRHPNNAEFESPLLSALIGEHHYYCSRMGYTPSRFKKEGGKHYRFLGWFPDLDKWHAVSWRKCFNPPSFDSEVAAFFRRVFDELRQTLQAEFRPPCSSCGASGTVHMHHRRPTFNEMMQAIAPLFSNEDRASWLGYDWLRDDEFTVPLSHAAHQEYLRLQARSALVPLCAKCHAEEHRQMRTAS